MIDSQTKQRRAAALAGTAFALALFLLPCVARAQTATPQETPPPPAAPRSINVPKPVEQTLKNGLRVVVIEDHDMPLVSAQLVVKNGGEVDPATLSGVADMTASLLTKGTKTRTAPQIAQEIEALGASSTRGRLGRLARLRQRDGVKGKPGLRDSRRRGAQSVFQPERSSACDNSISTA